MSAVRDGVTVRPRPDIRRLDRTVAAVLMPIGPACAAVLRFVYPAAPVGESVAAHPEAMRLILALSIGVTFTLVPGACAALRLVRCRAPRLSAWAGGLLIPGYLGMAGLLAGDAGSMAGYDVGLPFEEADRVRSAVMGLPAIAIMLAVFVVGHVVGTVLLGIAAISAQVAPVAVSILLAVSQPAHLAAVILGSPVLDFAAWGSTAVAMGFLAWRVLKTPDDEWDLPPAAME